MKNFKTYAFIILIATVLTGCSNSNQNIQENNQKNLYQGEIIIGYMDFLGYAPLLIAEDKGFFDEAGLNVKLKSYHSDIPQLSKDYLNGKMQGKANMTMTAVQETISGFNHKIVLVIDYSNGADGIIAHKDIAEMKDMKGKKLGYPKGFMEEFIIQWIFKKHGFSLKDVVSVNGEAEELIKKLKKKEVDAIPIYEPFLGELIAENPDLHLIYSSASTPALITDVLTFPSDFVEENPETIKTIVEANFKAVEFIKNKPDEAHELLAKRFGTNKENIAKMMDKVVILDNLANRSAFNQNDNIQSIHENIKNLYLFLKGTEIDENTLQNLIDSRFIK